jgi:L-ascorbate metabolism protein UlaG (beta-lactamase superfamily)
MRAQVTFIGNATVLLRIGDFTLLTDPAFGAAGSRVSLGHGMWTKRLRDPELSPLDDVDLDGILLSHLHGDHFDHVARRGLDRRYPVLTTPAAAGRLRSWGFDASGLETWQTRTFERPGERLTLSALPGVHARGLLRPLLPPVMGSLLEHEGRGRRHRVYVTGDTLTGPHLDDIRRRFEPIDTVVAHLGGTRVLFHTVTMDAPQGVQLLRQVPAARVVPVHYDDYRVFRSRVEDFVDLMGRQDLGTEVVVPARGETVDL